MNEVHSREFEYILFSAKKLIGSFIVQIQCGDGYDRVFDVGQITEIYCNDIAFFLKVDGNTWLFYLWDGILPDVTEDKRTICVHDKLIDVKFVILKQNPEK